MHDIDAEFFFISFDQAARHGRAADDQLLYAGDIARVPTQFVIKSVPNRGHAGGDRHALGFNQFGQGIRLEMRFGHNHCRADVGASVGKPPGHGMELWHDRQ